MKKRVVVMVVITTIAMLLMVAVVMASTGNIVTTQLTEKNEAIRNEGIQILADRNDSLYDQDKSSLQVNENDYIDQFNKMLIEKFNNALDQGFVYQYEMYLNEDNLHEYRFVHSFTKEELKGAKFEDNYSKINISGSSYYIKWGFPGQFKEEDAELPEIDEWTIILRVFTEENWLEGNRILAVEQHEAVKNNVIIPLLKDGINIVSNEDRSVIRSCSSEEIKSSLVSENGVFVKISDEIYVVNLTLEGKNVLRPFKGYGGDAGFLDPYSYKFYSLEEWMQE